MNNHIINHFIPKQAEGSYYTIGFPVPDGTERVTVSYSYNRIAKKIGRSSDIINIVDLGLEDSNGRFLGWSGSNRSTVFVGPHASTKGYLMTELLPGEWKIIIGAYKIPKDGLTVRYEITYTPKKSRWLSGDLHMHSDASDGRNAIYTLTQMAQKEGLDFIAVSNHNNYSENLNLPSIPGLTLIPAVEWTHYRGHMNFFGVPSPFDNSFVANSEEDMLALAAQAKEKGAVVSVNHPKCKLCPYTWEDTDCFDLIEVWNGPMRDTNMNSIKWWHKMLTDGKYKPLVGGSDYHKDWSPVRFAKPVTWVYSESPASESILKALKQGNCYISASVKGVQIRLKYGDAIMGDTTVIKDGVKLSIRARGLGFGMRVKLVTARGVMYEQSRFKDGRVSASVPVSDSWRFAYLIVTREILGISFVCAISNPIQFNGS